MVYNALLQKRHELPVASTIVLLAPGADGDEVSGSYRTAPSFGPAWEFRYTVVRVWELPAGPFLNGPLAVLPLAAMADVDPSGVPDVLRQVGDRLSAEADPATAGLLWRAMSILLSLRYTKMTVTEWLRELPGEDEIPFFQAMKQVAEERGMEKGRVEALRVALLRQGRKKFKAPPSAAAESTVNAVTDPARLEALLDRVLDVSSWDDLLAAQ